MPVTKIDAIDFNTVYQVLTSNKISEAQKTQFIRNNKTEIAQLVDLREAKITSSEYSILMKNRPLIKFKPIKNSFTKRGDKALLAKSLGIKPSEIDGYIERVISTLNEFEDLDFLPKDTLDTIKTYVYRHGSKDGVVAFLDYELTVSKDLLKTLYRPLDYHPGGVADYFIRPIHRMDNKTLIKLYNVIDKQLNCAKTNNMITNEQNQKIAEFFRIFS